MHLQMLYKCSVPVLSRDPYGNICSSKVESRGLVSDATPEAEVTCAMTSTPCVCRDSAHARAAIHQWKASAVNKTT